MSRPLTSTRAIRTSALAAALVMTARHAPHLSAQTAPSAPTTGACHVSPIVENLDTAAHFYHDLLGLNLVPAPPPGPLPWDTNPGHLQLHGMPQAKLRFIGARMPGVFCGVELVEFAAIDRRPVHRRLQDPGAVILILLVRDLEPLFARLKEAGVPVVTTGGAPMVVGEAKTRVVIVKDPDGHFVELVQADPLPETTAPDTANVIGVRIRLTVDDADQALHLYRDVLGLAQVGERGEFRSNDAVMAMFGMKAGQYRFDTVQVPGTGLRVEFIDFKGVDRKTVRARIQDPGSTRMQLQVRDVDAAIAALKGAGGSVVSAGGSTVELRGRGGATTKVAIVRDPNNLFLVLLQAARP